MKIVQHPLFPKYDIREDGRVFARYDAGYRKAGRELFGRVLSSGYRQFKLVDINGERRSYRANRLILEAFKGRAPTSEHQAAHENGVRLDNRVDNLNWKTWQENEEDKDRHGTILFGDSHPRAKISFSVADAMRSKYSGRHGDMRRLSREFGVSIDIVSRVIRNKAWIRDDVRPGKIRASAQ